MSLSYDLYQIGYLADADTSVSYVKDSGLALTDVLPAEEEGRSDESQQIVRHNGSVSDFDSSFFDDEYMYVIINGEVITVKIPNKFNNLADDELEVWVRAGFGTPLQSHEAGDSIYYVKPSRAQDVTVNTDLRRIREVDEFNVEEVDQFEEAVEYEKGTFRVSNLSATVSGIGRHTLAEAGSIQSPWVFEVRDSADSLLFQGVLKDDAKFNGSTEKINFTAVSWLEILNRVESLPPRVKYETEIVNVRVGDASGNVSSDLTVKFKSSDKFTSNFPNRGDTVAIETGQGEIRRVATSATQGEPYSNIKIPVDGFFSGQVYSSKGDTTSNPIEVGKQEEYTTEGFGGVENTNYYREFRFKNLTDDLKSTLKGLSNPNKYKILLFDSGDTVVEQLDVNKRLVNKRNENWPKVFDTQRGLELINYSIPQHAYFVIVKNTGGQALRNKVNNTAEGDKITILSQEMWGESGVDEDGDGMPDFFEPQSLLNALFKTNIAFQQDNFDGTVPEPALGVLPEIMETNGVVFGRGSVDNIFEPIDPRVEFPSAPIKAVRMIQENTGTMLRVNTDTQSNSYGEALPSVQFELLPRKRLLEDSNRTQLEDVTDWNEDIAEKDVRAVVIEPNKQYGGGGEDQPEYLGIYTDKMDRNINTYDEPSGRPEGDDVIEIKTAQVPKLSGIEYQGGEERIVNDEHLKSIAKLYYEQFNDASRPVTFSVGKDNPDVLAKYVSVKEGRVVDDSVLVTQKRHYLEEDHRETELVGRIGGRANFDATAPVVDIRSARAFRARSNDFAEVKISGRNSYDARPGTLSYQWEFKKASDSTWQGGGAGAVFETFVGIQSDTPVSYDVRLTVTNNNTGESAQGTDQFVVKPYVDVDDETSESNEVDYSKTQNTQGENRFGRVTATLSNPELVERDSNGNLLFEFRAAKGSEVGVSDSWYRVGSGNGPVGSGQVTTDSNGNVTGFYAEVQLDKKHVSNIQTRIKWTDAVGFNNQIRTHAFDFDQIAEADASVYNDTSGAVYADVTGDNDTDTFDVEYRKNDGNWELALSGQSTDITGFKVLSGSNVSDGDSVEVRITPFGFDAAEGEQVVRATFYNRSTGGESSLDSLTVNGAGTIDSINSGEFRVLDESGNDNAVIDVFNIQVDQINGNSVSTFAKAESTRQLARSIVQTRADLDTLDAVTVRRAREVRAEGTQNQVSVDGRDGALTEDIDLTLSLPQDIDTAADVTFNSVTLGSQASSTDKAVRADRSILGGEGIQDAGDLTSDPTVEVDSTVARTDRNEVFNEDVKVVGSLTVEGEETIVDTTTLEAEDNLLFLNAGDSGAGVTKGQVGFEADRGTSPPINLIFDESDDLGRVGVKYRTLSYSGASGTFNVNETVVGSSGAEGVVWADTGSKLRIKGRTGSFDPANDTLEGQSSGTTASLDSVSTVDMTQAIATREDAPAEGGIPYYNPRGGDMGRYDTTKALTYEGAGSSGEYNGEEVQISAGIGHPDYTAELKHWYITPGGLGDFRTLLADELRVEAFIAEVEEALAGSDFLTKSFGTLDEPFDVPSSGAVGTQKDLTVQDLDGLGATPVFGNDTSEEDDTLRLRIVDRSGGGLTVADIWLRAIAGSYTDNGDGTQTWTVEILQEGDNGIGAGLTAPTGSVVLDYGVPGDFLIERSVLDPDSGDIAPYDRMLKWKDNDGDRIPDDFDVLNLRGRLDGLPKAYASGFGTYTETGRFTSDVAIGDLEAADQDSDTGSYLRYNDDGIKIVNSDGYEGAGDNSYSEAILQLEDDVRLLAREQVQGKERNASLELKANENRARIDLTAEIVGDDSLFSQSSLSLFASKTQSRFRADVRFEGDVTTSAGISMKADSDGSSIRLSGDSITVDGNTTFFPTTNGDGIPGDALVDDYATESNVTIYKSGNPNNTDLKRPGGGDLQNGDIYFDTSNGNRPWVYDTSKDPSAWVQQYTSIDGGDIDTNTIKANRLTFSNTNGKITGENLLIDANVTFQDSPITNDALKNDYTKKGTENVTIRSASKPGSRNNGDHLLEGDLWIDTNDGEKPYVHNGQTSNPKEGWTQAYTSINGGNIDTDTISLNKLDFRDGDGKIKADALGITATNLDIDATDVTISGATGSDVKSTVLQLEDDVRLLAENITQERESRAGLELKANETAARFQADVRFEGSTASVSLVANSDGSTARLAGDSIILDGDTTVNGSSFLNGDVLVDGTIDTDKITIANALTLQPGGAFFAGQGQTRFAFGDFSLDRQTKGQVTYSIGASASARNGETVTSNTETRFGNYGSGEWLASHSAKFKVSTSDDATADVQIHIVARDSSGNVVAQNNNTATASSGPGGSDSKDGKLDVSLSLPADTDSIDFYVVASNSSRDRGAAANADIGTEEVSGDDTVTNVTTSTDFFGPDGATWRSGGAVQIEINGRGDSSSQTTQAGEIYVRNGVSTGSDLRDKSDVARASGLDVLRDIRGLTYTKDERAEAGVGAQDLLNTFDRAVRGSEEEGYSVAYSALTAPVIEAIKELDSYTQDHEARIAALERENERLRSLIQQ